ncbi:MBOAT family protein [Marinihelvus fidelis]|uniref:Probable alginate O-acetylase n=1 Tax=Marinihelvus fidelis TaxID=2613842 RepID=A0A5N0T8L7_9GAMM|nr:MBOAT family O-acyltransferase [Marinihelvus fidelis]KAA9131373.1 MBOAT family protein [Marinihelvus fidelis]
MVFSSITFLFVFLPLFLVCYVILPWRNLVALSFSLLFFAWGEGTYLLLLLATITLNHQVGRWVRDPRWGRLALATGVAVNLAILAWYKYLVFIMVDVLRLPPLAEPPHLPIGLSFFIFQSISYLVDVRRGTAPRARSWFDLALYISMFPQLIAGPIVRYQSVAEAIRRRVVSAGDVYRGCVLFATGLAAKVLVANNVAVTADAVFALEPEQLSSAAAWTGALAYSLQIYFDFAGYSLMAIGIGRFMGFRFPRNFNHPYAAHSVTDFWRRWHISLSTWFRDYVYIPLGGNRKGPARTYANLFVVFVLCGLWHGAAWVFLAWGLYHGGLLVAERAGLERLLLRLWAPLRHAYTLLAVLVGWVLFRAEDIHQAGRFLATLFVPANPSRPESLAALVSHESAFFMLVGVACSVPFWRVLPFSAGAGNSALARPAALAASLAALLVCSVYVMSGGYNPFIYFRF